jgi:hypothetical protein
MGGGGGGGGYRNSYASESSGGGASTETPLAYLLHKLHVTLALVGRKWRQQCNGSNW